MKVAKMGARCGQIRIWTTFRSRDWTFSTETLTRSKKRITARMETRRMTAMTKTVSRKIQPWLHLSRDSSHCPRPRVTFPLRTTSRSGMCTETTTTSQQTPSIEPFSLVRSPSTPRVTIGGAVGQAAAIQSTWMSTLWQLLSLATTSFRSRD